MSERRGTKGLELWCKKMTEGYPGVKIDNMTTSWRDGLAFCAIIHHFRPDLIDFSNLTKDDVYHNNELAFRVAEHHLGIPALLDPEDMVEYSVPDRLSILTYLSQFYQAFAVPQGSSPRIAAKRPQPPPEHEIGSPTSSSPPTKVVSIGAGKIRREPCAKCHLPVFLAERLNIGKLLFHRTCFRCARCDSQLTLAGYYETEKGEFCCELCPDEEKSIAKSSDEKMLLQRSMSDEEKSASLRIMSTQPDDYSAMFETALESEPEDSAKTGTNEEFTQARSDFFQSQIASSDSGHEEPPKLPKSEPPGLDKSDSDPSGSSVRSDSGFLNLEPLTSDKVSVVNQIESSRDLEDIHVVTKEVPSPENNVSLVRARMRLFENDTSDISKSDVHRISQNTNQVPKPRVKPVIPIVKLDDLENFDDNISKYDTDDNKIISAVTQRRGEENNVSNKILAREEKELSPDQMAEAKSVVPLESLGKTEVSKDVPTSKDNTPLKEVLLKDNNSEASPEKYPPDVGEETEDIPEKICSSQQVPPEGGSNESESLKDSSVEIMKNSIPIIDISSDASVIVIEDSAESNSVDVEESSVSAESSHELKEPSTGDISQLEESPRVPSRSSRSPEKKGNLIEKSPVPKKRSIEKSPDEEMSTSENLDEYPDDLNPFGDDEESDSLNPFDSDEDEDPAKSAPTPRLKKKIIPNDYDGKFDGTPVRIQRISMNPLQPVPKLKKMIVPPSSDRIFEGTPIRVHRESINPFAQDDGEDAMPVPTARKRKPVVASRVGLNPFGSDEDDDDEGGIDESISSQPSPKPRITRPSVNVTPETKPRESNNLTVGGGASSTFGSTSSLSSSSAYGSARKKKPAPKPPIPSFMVDSANSSLAGSPSHSVTHSPRVTPKNRKLRKAPPPPGFTSTPLEVLKVAKETDPEHFDSLRKLYIGNADIGKEKNLKDEENRIRQTYENNLQIPTSSKNPSSLPVPNKSTYGQWKRRKGQAPKRPIPQRRVIKCLPMSEIRSELDLIEVQQQGLERQGVRIEQIIREKCEGTEEENAQIIINDDLPIEVEDLILQLFEIVNEKNELFRKQAELMYLKRQQRLEEEHADVEYQIRCLMLKPEDNKTDSDKAKEEELIKRLVDIVERRNEIIECLEMDRVREAEEDSSISNHISLYTSKRDNDKSSEKSEPDKSLKEIVKEKTKKKHKKEEKTKHKSKSKLDIRRDEDEREYSATLEKKKKKKFNLF